MWPGPRQYACSLVNAKSSDPAKRNVEHRVNGRVDGGVDSGVIRLGLLGAGTVGSALVTLLQERAEAITARTGITLCITRVAVANLSKPRPGIDPAVLHHS